MTTIAEYASMAWDDPAWIDPLADAVAAVLEARPGVTFNTTALISELGLGGLRNLKAAKTLGAKLAAMRKPGEPLADYWRHSTTRFAPFKDKITGARLAAIDWVYIPPVKLTDAERRALIAEDNK